MKVHPVTKDGSSFWVAYAQCIIKVIYLYTFLPPRMHIKPTAKSVLSIIPKTIDLSEAFWATLYLFMTM